MNSLQIKAALAGVFFGAWPLFMNKSKMTGNVSSAFFTLVSFVCIFPFAIGGLKNLEGVNWGMLIAAGITGAIGVMFFNSMLAKAGEKDAPILFIVMIAVQTSIPAIYYAYKSGGMSPSKCVGIGLVIIAAILLTR